MRVAWAWGGDDREGIFLDFLSEHRHPGLSAARFLPNGRIEPLPTPASMRQVTGDSERDAEIEKDFFEGNRAAYAWLRARGLLPPEGQNLVPQDISEFLLKGGPAGAGRD